MTLKDLSLSDLNVVKKALTERFFNYPDGTPTKDKELLRNKIREVDYEITTKVNSINYFPETTKQ